MTEGQQASILFVDDEEASRHSLTEVLRGAGFVAWEAATGAEALRLAAERPDLIILDVNLPDVDGFEVCRRIKGHPATAAIPVLHMSGAFVRAEDKLHALEEGADGYMIKPVEPHEVVATVKSLLRTHQAEEAARQWQATFDALHDPLWLLSAEGQVLRCNQAMADLLGRSATELIGLTYRRFLLQVFGAAGERLASLLRQAPLREPCEVPLGERWFRATADLVPDARADAPAHVHLLADVPQRKALEEQLRQAQKMEAVGQLVGGVAHDFNNLLTAITGNLSLLLSQTPRDDCQRELMQATEQAAWQAAELARQLLDFSRRKRLGLRPLDLNACIKETMALVRSTIGPHIEVQVRCATDAWLVEADPGQMSQVLMNLCLNARDAMLGGGRLVVETGNVMLSVPDADAHPRRCSGEFVRLGVRDTGHGIPPDIRSRIFEPFFTTKEPGRGTGLGLTLVFDIIQKHRGWIECCSAVNEGTCFDIYLPRYKPSNNCTPAPMGTASPAGGEMGEL